MSYPPPRYHGSLGEVTATYRPAGREPEISNPRGGGTAYLATGALTEGKFGLYRWDMGPAQSGPDAHFHRTMSESFYILSGTVRLYDGETWVDAKPGDFLYVPEGGIHAFKNESGDPASMLILFSPGAAREQYFETLAEAGRRDAMSADELRDFYLRHDNHWL
jgi:mannose-6-phosphate isomerase-like protein (cupin superfamily)